MTPASRDRSMEERVAVLESEVTALIDQQQDLARLMRAHMDREDAASQRVMGGILSIEQRMSRWHGVAFGVAAAVSACWALVLAALSMIA